MTPTPYPWLRHERRVWKCHLRVSWLTYDIQLCYCSVVRSIGGFGDARWVSKISSRGTKIPWDLSRRWYVFDFGNCFTRGTIVPRDIWVVVRVWMKDTPGRMTLTTNVADFIDYGSRSGLGCSCTGLFCFDDFDALRRRCFGGPTLVTGRWLMVMAEVLPLETVRWEFGEISVQPQRSIYIIHCSMRSDVFKISCYCAM